MSVQNCGWDIGGSIDVADFLQLTGNQTMTITGEKRFGPNPLTVSEPTLPSQMVNVNNIQQYSVISPSALSIEGVSNIDIDNLCITTLPSSGVWTYNMTASTTSNVQQMIISIGDDIGNVISQSTLVFSTALPFDTLIKMTGFIDLPPAASQVSMTVRCITELGDNYTINEAELIYLKNQPVLGLFA
jgi:hypothetical protein